MLLSMGQVTDPFKYQLVIDHIRAMVANGLSRGSRLPTERDLSTLLGVSRVSVRRAFDELEESGEVRRVQGSGTFVQGPSVEKGGVIRSFTQETTAAGSTPGARVLFARTVPSSADVSWLLKISPGEPVVELGRVRTADGIPMGIETDMLAASLVPGLVDKDLTGSLYRILAEEYGLELATVQQTFRATTLDPEKAELLAVAAHSPALEVRHVAYAADGTVIHATNSLYRGDRYSISTEVPAAEWFGRDA